MSVPLKSQQDLQTLFINTLQSKAPQLTDTFDGSTIDALAGVFSICGTELQRYNILNFNKLFFNLANGPEVTGGPDDLQTLAVDRFGPLFARPGAKNAIDTATFSRPTAAAGAITIPSGTIIKTQPDANGNTQRYSTNSTVTLTGSGGASLTISVNITAVVAGAAGSASAGSINVIESTLLDPTIVVTNTGNTTGEDAQNDSTYRQTISNLVTALRAATRAAIEATALTVPGVAIATAIEIEQNVIFWNPATSTPIGQYFTIPFATLYIADAGGAASGSLIAAVKAAIDPIRAFGVAINVIGATPITVNWSAKLTLNPSGPNFALFSNDTTLVVNSMTQYIATLGAANSFIRATARTAILAIWGASGTNDLTDFVTTVPSGDVSITTGQSAIPGAVQTV